MLDLGVHAQDGDRRTQIEDAYRLAIELERRRCREDFGFFAKRAWHTIEPATHYVHGPHIEAIVDHLTACLPRVRYEERSTLFGQKTKVRVVEPGQIRKLLINMPPRHMKSTLVSVLWPAWVWTFRPDIRWLYTSYALSLSIRDTMKMRAVITSLWYQALFSDSFRLQADQNEKSKFFNNAMGYRVVGSPDAGVTGEGGDVVVCDDPHNVRDADSEIKREATNTWWFEAMSTRLNDAATGSFIVTMQRVHEKDLAARCRDAGYVHLNLPARYDSRRHCVTCLGWEDWRKDEGDLLWPERFPAAVMAELVRALGDYGVASQLDQDPKPRGGAFIKREWFKRIPGSAVRFLPALSWGRAWDLALQKDGDGVASIEYASDGDTIYLRRGLYWHEDLTLTLARVEEVSRAERNRAVFESIGTTKTAGEQAEKRARGHCVTALVTEKDDKVSMAIPWIARAQAGKVIFIEETIDEAPVLEFNNGPWIEHFLDKFCGWKPDPKLSQADDEIDCISIAHKQWGGDVPLDQVLAPMGTVSALTTDIPAAFSSGYEDDFSADDDEDSDGLGILRGGYTGGML